MRLGAISMEFPGEGRGLALSELWDQGLGRPRAGPAGSRLHPNLAVQGRSASGIDRRPHQHGQPRESPPRRSRSEEHTSELQSHLNLVCRLLLEKKKKKNNTQNIDSRAKYKTNSSVYAAS